MTWPTYRQTLKLLTAAVCSAALLTALPARAEMEPQPVAKLRTLDKITARTMTFEADVGSTVKFGPLFIKIRSCHKAPPIEQPESAAFLQIWENSLKDKTPQWVFSGWMFASSPALSPMDHPVYDVWVLDCLAQKTGTAPATEDDVTPEDDAAADADGAPDASAAQTAPVTPPTTAEPVAEEEIVEEEAPPSPDDDGTDTIDDPDAAYIPPANTTEPAAPFDAPTP
jgi:hypothetical protein